MSLHIVSAVDMHIVTNGGSTYAKVYINGTETDRGDFEDVMQRVLESLGVQFTHDRDDMSLPTEQASYDTTLDPISPDFDPTRFAH